MAGVPPSFLERLKRHYIFRIAATYALIAWILIQASGSILPGFGLPRDSVRFVIIVVALGFPVMLVLAWTFVKPRDVDPVNLSRWTRLRWRLGSALSIIVVVLVCISGWYLWRIAVTSHEAQSLAMATPPNSATTAFNPIPHSIAVLPFANLSTDAMQQYFSDGITEEVTNALGKLPGVRVIAWQSAAVYRGRKITVPDVGRALNVANVLVGSIMRDGERVRISAELVSAVTGYQLWSSHYDRTFKDVFAIQDDISKAIVSALQLQLAGNGPLVAAATTNPGAHDFYLKGLAASNARTAASLDEATSDFQRAIQLDPRYAEAYAALAWAYAIRNEYSSVPLAKSMPMAKRAAKQALRLNPNLAAAHVALGYIYMSEQNPRRAEKELRRALKLNPNDAEAHIVYGVLLPANRQQDQLAQYQQAAVLDPNSALAHYNLAVTYEDMGDYTNAITEYQATVGLAPQLTFARLDLASLYHNNADDRSAIAILSGVHIDDPQQAKLANAARLVYTAQQHPDLRDQALATLQHMDVVNMSASDKEALVILYAVLGQKDYAVQLLSQACATAPETCGQLAAEFKVLEGEPRFQKLVEKYSPKK